MKLNYWNADHLSDIAWEALPYHFEGASFLTTADAALSVAQESEGVEFCSRFDRAHAVRTVAHYMAAYLPEWQAGYRS